MYSRIVGIITRDVVSLLKQLMFDIKYSKHNNTIVSNISESNSIGDILSNIPSRTVGNYHDTKSNIQLSVSLQYMMHEIVPINEFYINGYAEEIFWPELELCIATNPMDDKTILAAIIPYIRETVRHEIEHFTQRGVNAKPHKSIRNNQAMRRKIRLTPSIWYKYLILKDEIDANIHGMYARAKTMKLPYQSIVDEYLDTLVNIGDITEAQKKIVYKAWKARIPKIGGIPELI